MNRRVMRFMPNILESKDMLLWLLAVALFMVISFMGLGKLGFVYTEAEKTKEQISVMTGFIEDWKKQTAKLQIEAYHPVKVGQVEAVQANILTILSKHRLDLVSFRNVQGGDEKKSNGKSFELTCRGTWESTIRMLEKVRAQNALIGVQHLKLEPDRVSGGVNVTLEYKIYTK